MAGMDDTPKVRHHADESRYELLVGDEVVGFAAYVERPDGVLDFNHTVVQPVYRGRGFAERLVTEALDDVRADDRRVWASCWYVDQFLIEHRDYADLRAD